MQNKSALVLLSGGQDSTTCLFWALNQFDHVEAIAFNYGQRHSIELNSARQLCEGQQVKLHEIDMKGLLGGSSLTDYGQSTSKPHEKDPSLPSSFTAGRNLQFLSIAASLGYNLGIHDLVTGVCQTDYSGYPDCRQQFISAAQLAISLATNKDFRIHTPLMYLTKAETWKLADALRCVDEIVNLTHTCYEGNHTDKHDWGYGCGECPACVIRKRGYEEYKSNN